MKASNLFIIRRINPTSSESPPKAKTVVFEKASQLAGRDEIRVGQVFADGQDSAVPQQAIKFPNQQFLLEVEAAAHFFTASLVSLLTFWLDNNLPLSPGEINDLFKRLTMPGIQTVIETVRHENEFANDL